MGLERVSKGERQKEGEREREVWTKIGQQQWQPTEVEMILS